MPSSLCQALYKQYMQQQAFYDISMLNRLTFSHLLTFTKEIVRLNSIAKL